jgi:adenine-specific DNA-methyltransferase
VLDFFAGSGTTGHAVALANAADGGRRTCLSVNSAEPTRPGSNAHQAGLLTVADITRARLRAVAETVGGGFDERSAAVADRGVPPSRTLPHMG